MKRTYKIHRKRHRSGIFFKPYLGRKRVFKYRISFDISCCSIYSGVDRLDANKLLGISFGFHHKNSIRIGWRGRADGRIQLGLYTYNRGVRIIKWLDFKCVPGVNYNIALSLSDTGYTFWVDGDSKTRHLTAEPFNYPIFRLGYYLFPYFGGNRTAPNDMFIDIERL